MMGLGFRGILVQGLYHMVWGLGLRGWGKGNRAYLLG